MGSPALLAGMKTARTAAQLQKERPDTAFTYWVRQLSINCKALFSFGSTTILEIEEESLIQYEFKYTQT